MKILAHQVDQLVCVLAGRGDSHGAGPVEVHVGELVGQLLDAVGAQEVLAALAQDDEVRGGDGALRNGLRHQEEVLEREPGKKKILGLLLGSSNFNTEFTVICHLLSASSNRTKQRPKI